MFRILIKIHAFDITSQGDKQTIMLLFFFIVRCITSQGYKQTIMLLGSFSTFWTGGGGLREPPPI